MHFTIKTLALIMATALSGCTGGILNCTAPVGTDEYNLCHAKNGSREAQYLVGVAAMDKGDMDTAIKWLEKSAEPDDGMRSVYFPSPTGKGVGRIENLPQGIKHTGIKDAQILLSKIYMGDMGVEADNEKAIKYRRLANGTSWMN